MKKLFSSILAVSVSFACCLGSSMLTGYADAINTESGTINLDSEELLLGEAEELNLTFAQTPAILSNSSSDAYNYVDFLDKNNLAVYNALVGWTTPSLDVVTVKLPETISLNFSGLPGTSEYTEEDQELFSTSIFANCKPGLDSLLFDTPEIFWLDEGSLSIGTSSVSYTYNKTTKKYNVKISTIHFTPALISSYGSLENAMIYKGKLDTAIECFDVSGETRYDMLKDIHDTISLFTFYDLNADFSSSAVGSLVEPGVVCEGYAKGFKLICDKLNIPCVLVFGNYNETTQVAHMWNSVQMEDGLWYGVDVTWDDLDGAYGMEVKYDYFLKGSGSFFLSHTEEQDFVGTNFTYPEIAEENYEPQQTTTTTATTQITTTAEITTITTTEEVTETTSTETTTDTTTVTSTTETTTETTSATTTVTSTTETITEATTTVETTETTVSSTTETTTETTTEAPEVTTTTAIQYENGDYNQDGVVNVADLVICVKSVMGLSTGYFCDFDNDGTVDVFDVIAMRQHFVDRMN